VSTDNLDRIDRLKNPEKYAKEKEVWNSHQEPKTPKGKVENFWYHYKWHTIGSILAAAFVIFFIVNIATKVKYDYRVMLITSKPVMEQTSAIIETGLNKYAINLNGDKRENTSVMSVEMNAESENANPQMVQANVTKYMAELTTGEIIIFIVDKINYDKNIENEVFADKNGETATPDTPIENVAYPIKDTSIGRALAEQNLENDYYICFRVYSDKDPSKESAKDKNNKEAHELIERFIAAQ